MESGDWLLVAACSPQPEVTAQMTSTPEQTHSLQHAPRANLDAVARGEDASRLVTSLSNAITAWEQRSGKRKNIRHKGLENLKGDPRRALGDSGKPATSQRPRCAIVFALRGLDVSSEVIVSRTSRRR
jgi:hypothetical protein